MSYINRPAVVLRPQWDVTPHGKKRGFRLDMLGYIPTFLNQFDERPAKEQFGEAYAHGGGWRASSSWKLIGTLTHNPQLYAPSDEQTFDALACARLRQERIFYYDYSIVAIVQPDGTCEICRMD